MNKEETINIYGGISILESGTGINAIVKIFGFILEIGQKVGSAIRRNQDGTYCS